MTRPSLLLVTGAPGSGKTTLATYLAHTLSRVRLSRDDFKEQLWDAWKEEPELLAQVPRAHWGLYYAALGTLLEAGVDVVAEGSVHRVLGVSEVERLRAIADVRLIHCQTPRLVSHARFQHRATPARHPAHQDSPIVLDLQTNPERWAHFEEPPPVMCPVLCVTTTHGYTPSLIEILNFAQLSC